MTGNSTFLVNESTWCEWRNGITASLVHVNVQAGLAANGVDWASAGAQILFGFALLIAPLLFGKRWHKWLLWFVAFIFGATLASLLVPLMPHTARLNCMYQIMSTFSLATSFAGLAICCVEFAFFSVGATLGGSVGQVAAGLIYPLLEEHEIEIGETKFDAFGAERTITAEEKVMYVTIIVCAFVCGALLVRYSDRLIDLACGAVGAFLVAQNFVDQVGSSKWDMYTVLVIAGVLLLGRYLLMYWQKKGWECTSCQEALRKVRGQDTSSGTAAKGLDYI